MIQDYDEKASFTLSHNGQDEKVRYADLKRYATSIASLLPEGEKGVKRIFYSPHWPCQLQEICRIFNQEFQPNMIIEDITQGQVSQKMQNAQKFSYNEIDYQNQKNKKIVAYLLKSCPPKE